MKLAKMITRFSKRFVRDDEGSVLVLFGLSVLFLVGIGGAGVDLGQRQLTSMRMQQAADAAAVGAASLSSPTVSSIGTNDRTNAANRYFGLNWPATAGAAPTPTIAVDAAAGTVQVGATAPVNTTFIGAGTSAGTLHLTAAASSTVTYSNPPAPDFDIVVAVGEDSATSNYMANTSITYPGLSTRMGVIKSFLPTLVDNIMPPGGVANPNIRFGLISYTTYDRNKWSLTDDPAMAKMYITKLASQTIDHQDDATAGIDAAGSMLTGGSETVSLGSVTASALSCDPAPPGWSWTTSGCTADKHTEGSGFGCTITCPDGTNWGGGTSNFTQGPWAMPTTATARTASGTTSMSYIACNGGGVGNEDCRSYVRNLILITSGPTVPAFPSGTMASECASVKGYGVNIYVINMGDTDPTEVANMTSCASTDPVTGAPHYYYVTDETGLTNTFSAIVSSVKTIRISH